MRFLFLALLSLLLAIPAHASNPSTDTMPRLTELSNIESQRGRDALATLLEVSPYVAYLEQNGAFEEEPTEYEHTPATGTQDVGTRTLYGPNYNATDIPYQTRQAGTLAFHGFEQHIDRSIIADRDRGLRGVDRYLARHLPKKQRSFSRGYEQKSLTGDPGTNAGEMTGLLTLVDGVTNVPGIGATMSIDAADWLPGAADHFDLTVEANQALFIEKLMTTIPYVPMCNGLVMNHTLQGLLTTIMHRLHVMGEARNLFGEIVTAFNQKPLVGVRESSIGNDFPDVAAATVTTKLIISAAMPGYLSVVTNSGLEFQDWDEADELDDNNERRVRCEMRSNTKIDDDEAVIVIHNIKAIRTA